MKKKIALFGGTFNPIHYGHLLLAQTAKEYFSLDKVIFIPAGVPPHKRSPLACAYDRYRMTRLAIEGNKNFSSSPVEIKTKGKSYTYKTIRYFKKKYPKEEIFFLAGSDLLWEIDTWKGGRKLLDLCPFLVGLRKGFPLRKVDKAILEKVVLFPFLEIEISGSIIREKIKKGESIKYFLPEKVERYIKENNLYGEKK
jgi:nicotinate-nucleotide adenylyltransferase